MADINAPEQSAPAGLPRPSWETAPTARPAAPRQTPSPPAPVRFAAPPAPVTSVQAAPLDMTPPSAVEEAHYDLAGNLVTTAAPKPPTPSAPRPPDGPNAGLNYSSSPRDFVDTTPVEPLKASQVLLGIGLALVVGTLGSVGIEKILFYAHFGFPYLYLIVGAAVAGSLRWATSRGGPAMAAGAAALMLVCLAIGHVVLVNDYVSQLRADGEVVTFSEMFPVVLGHLTFIHWMMVAGGVILAAVTANREAKPGF